MTDLDEIQKEIISICEKEYGAIDRNRYFVAKDTDVSHVRKNILDKLSGEEKKKIIYLDMSVYILQVDSDVFISLN